MRDAGQPPQDDVVDEWNREVAGRVHQVPPPMNPEDVRNLVIEFLTYNRRTPKTTFVRSPTTGNAYEFLIGRRTQDLRITVLLCKTKRRILVCRAFLSKHKGHDSRYDCDQEFISLMDEQDGKLSRWNV